MKTLNLCTLAMLVALGGCDSGSEPDAAAAAPKPAAQQAKTPAAQAPADPTSKMARAVGGGKPGAAVELRYEFDSRPSIGASTAVEVAFLPSVGVDALDATISGMEGITVAGDLTPKFEKVEPGKPYTHEFSLLPDRTGVFYVTVVVNTQIGGSSIGRTFSIPFVVGNPPQAEKPQPQQDSTGQPIQPMKAAEPKD